MRTLVRAVVILLCVFVPPMLTGRDWWIVNSTFGASSEPFELLGMLVSAAVLLDWASVCRTHGHDRSERIVARIVVGALVLHTVYLFVNHPVASGDYRSYDGAARSVLAGTNPYADTFYLYPPLLAQCLAWVHTFILAVPWFSVEKSSSWWLVFYFYQALQILLLSVAVEQCFALGRRLRIPLAHLALLIVALFVVSEPMFRTLRFNQVNLLVLVAILYSLAHLERRPWVCGALIAVSVFVKPQAALLPLVWLLIGYRGAVLAFVLASVALVFVQADFGRDWTLWSLFIGSIHDFPQFNQYFRNQSLFSFFSNLTHAFGAGLPDPELMWFVRACYVLILGWFAQRFLEREKRFQSGLQSVPEGDRDWHSLVMRTGAHTADVIILALLGAPLVWEHHYVLALPIALWSFAATRGRVPRLALVGLVLIFVPSTFDVWPLSYHRLVGLLMVSVALSPRRLQQRVVDAAERRYVGSEGLASLLDVRGPGDGAAGSR